MIKQGVHLSRDLALLFCGRIRESSVQTIAPICYLRLASKPSHNRHEKGDEGKKRQREHVATMVLRSKILIAHCSPSMTLDGFTQ